MMAEKEVEALIEQAHQIFCKTSIYEVINMDRKSATAALAEFYGPD
jgi:hypothetical protein